MGRIQWVLFVICSLFVWITDSGLKMLYEFGSAYPLHIQATMQGASRFRVSKGLNDQNGQKRGFHHRHSNRINL